MQIRLGRIHWGNLIKRREQLLMPRKKRQLKSIPKISHLPQKLILILIKHPNLSTITALKCYLNQYLLLSSLCKDFQSQNLRNLDLNSKRRREFRVEIRIKECSRSKGWVHQPAKSCKEWIRLRGKIEIVI